MIYLEIHDDPHDDKYLQEFLECLRITLLANRLVTDQCKFKLVRNGDEYIKNGKLAPFIRIVVTKDDDVASIIAIIQELESPKSSYGLDIVTMPVFIRPGEKTGRWYDPTDSMCAARHIRKE